MAELKVIEGKQQGKSIPLNAKNFLIGREQDCQLRPTSDLVSRHHCVFSQDGYTVRLRDLGSTNGTFVNGERIQGQVVLNDGDRVQIGKLAFQVSVRLTADAALPEAVTSGTAGSLSLDDLSSQPPSAEDPLSDSAVLGNSETELNTGKTEAGPRDSSKTMEIPAYDSAAYNAAETEAGMFGGDTTVIAPTQQPTGRPASPLGPLPPLYPAQRPPGNPGTPSGGFPQYSQPAPAPYPPPQYVPPPAYPVQQPSYAPPPAYPGAYPQAGYPGMTGYPSQPVYQQPAYPQPGYPPMPGYPGGYPQPAMAYPPAGNPYPQQAAAPVIESPSSASKRAVPNPPMSLPPPEETGARAPEPKPEEVKAADGSAPPAKKPSSAAADIIRAHMQRRPGAS